MGLRRFEGGKFRRSECASFIVGCLKISGNPGAFWYRHVLKVSQARRWRLESRKIQRSVIRKSYTQGYSIFYLARVR